MRSDNSFLAYLKQAKGIRRPILLLLIGALFLILASRMGATDAAVDPSGASALERMEEEVAALCSSVRGVGDCVVMLTFARGEESVYQGTRVVSVSPPRVSAVSVVCEGGDSPSVKSELTAMLTSLFDIGANRVTILKLSEKNGKLLA